jgi:hypothetical protein
MSVGPPDPGGRRRIERRRDGAVLMAVGGIMAFLCGACTFTFSVPALLEQFRPPYPANNGAIVLYLLIGGIPTGAGIVTFILGFQMFRGAGRS